jgi:hypothetical protein
MIKAIFILTGFLVTTFSFAQKSTDNFTGKYKTDDGGTVIITKTSNGFVGIDDMKKVVLKDIKFDYSQIRPAGARLETAGGRASGPQPLMDLMDFAKRKILSNF